MKNFLRVLRHAWPYRYRLGLSIAAALCAAVLWGLNFTSIYPVLKLLHTRESLHTWIDGVISSTQKNIDDWQAEVERLSEETRALDRLPPSKQVDKEKRDKAAKLLKLEVKLRPARFSCYWCQVLREYIHKFLPDDCFKSLAYLIGLVVIGIVIKCSFEFCQESLVGNVVNHSLCDLRNRFFRNVIRLDIHQFSGQGSTEMMARFTNDVESLAAGLKTLFGRVIAEPLKVISCVVIACMISWQLTLMFLILVPIAALILYRVGRIMKNATRRVLERMSNIYKVLNESFEGIRLVKVFTREAHERRRFRGVTRDYHQKSMRVINIEALADPVIEILGVMAVAAALLVGSYLVLTGKTGVLGIQLASAPMEAEAMLNLYVLLAAIADPVRKLASVFTRLQSANAAADRIFAFIDRQPQVLANSDGPRLRRPAWLPCATAVSAVGGADAAVTRVVVPARPGHIEFRDVCFSYEPGKPILSHISLAIRAGETIALVGANGSGKSTLLGLLPRFYDPDHGSVLIDGMDLRRVHLRSLRRQIGLVTQDTFLFEGTIFENIRYGRRHATAAEVEEAARRAHAHDFILSHPSGLGYEMKLGKGGIGLSGGQRQRLALARAILRNPSILLLDEFTNQADGESQLEIHRALQEYKTGRNVFVITHQLHTLEIADRIVMLDAGRIVAVGTHAELMASCPAYQRLHEAQTQRLCA
jgi:ATP-binding cassette subfamily B protein/subfamily B ATP-binding cassette protein MsbA